MNELYIDFLARELVKDKLIIFVGAGVSINSKLPSWNKLVEAFAKELNLEKEQFTSEEIFEIPEKYYSILGKVPFYRVLENIFKKEFEPNSIHEALEKLEFNYIITTNFDTLIENKLNENYEYDVIKKDEDLAHSSKTKMIIKMHGDFDNKNIILKKSDFENYEEKFPLISTFIKGLFTTNTILFIGYSLNDPNVKNMLSWIKSILKEDFRKVYLVDFKSENKTEKIENEEIINKVILPDMNKKEYLTMAEEKLLENKEKLLTDFLEDLFKKREEKIIEEDYLIYSKLDYLTEMNLTNLIKNLRIKDFNANEILENKCITSINNEKNLILSEIKKYIEILIKSDICTIEDTLLVSIADDKAKIEELISKQEKLNKLLDYIISYDKENFTNFIKKNTEINSENIVVSGYIFFKQYDLAKKILEKKLTEYKKNSNKEKILWTYFLLRNIEILENIFSKVGINIEKIYNKYFKIKTNLYYEIVDFQTTEKIKRKMSKLLKKVKNNKNSYFWGISPLTEAIFLVRDIYKFNFINGIPNSFSSISDIFKNYIEILFITFKNNLDKKNSPHEEILKLDKFEYFDYFLMLEISNKDLMNLIEEYNIIKLESNTEVLNKLLITFKNLLALLDSKQKHFNDIREKLENILCLINKHTLTEEQFNLFFDFLLQSKNIDVFYKENFVYNQLQSYFITVLDKNKNFMLKNKFNELFDIIIKSQEKSNLYVIGVLTYYYSTLLQEKIELSEELQNYFFKNDTSVKIYFLRLFSEDIKQKEITIFLTELNKKFDLNIYFELLKLEYIEPIIELEQNIIPSLDTIFLKKYIICREYTDVIYSLYILLEENKFSPKLKSQLTNYNNENFKYFLEKRGWQIEWEYFLDKENFDYSRFSISNLTDFTEFGIQKIIEKGKNNKKFMESIYEYLNYHANDNILRGYLKAKSKEDI